MTFYTGISAVKWTEIMLSEWKFIIFLYSHFIRSKFDNGRYSIDQVAIKSSIIKFYTIKLFE